MDIGYETRGIYEKVIRNSKTILWNGPMGVFELPEFSGGTEAVAHAIAQATREGAYSLAGGGETSAAINKLDLTEEFSHVSTGGGALLKYIENRTIPAVRALETSPEYAEHK
jgi:phosphoglycerate kinase